jgi:hypothetical protein
MNPPKLAPTLTPTRAELFFIERSQELLSSASIETYRLPLHNPKTILRELSLVIKSFHSGEIPKDEYAKLLSDELSALFKSETYLKFKSIGLKSLQVALKNYSLPDIFYCCTLLLEENKNYIKDLIGKIKSLISELNQQEAISPGNFEELNQVVKYFLIELHQTGYSKQYLYRFFTAIFNHPDVGAFTNRLNIIESLISRELERFKIIVGFVIKPGIVEQLEILDPELKKIDAAQITIIIKETNSKVREFFSNFPDNTFYQLEIEDRDYYSASNQVRKNLQLMLDVLHMGYSGEEFSLNSKCIVIGSFQPKRAGIHNLSYQLDGFFKNDQQLYMQFSGRLKAIKDKDLATETINRIESALRYLRLGSNVKEHENKLLNYWIGMEYFFASNDAKHSKTLRMREYFKRMHGKIYIKRLLLDFHQSIRNLGLQETVVNYNDDLAYLTTQANFEAIETNAVSSALAFRAYMLRKKLFDRKALSEDLKRHVLKLEWNLVRIYRIRNSVVHSAVIDTNILDITSHLRYYLIFAINSAVDYFNNEPIDINHDGKYNLEDYFLINKVELDNLIIDDSLSITKLLQIRNPMEFLS